MAERYVLSLELIKRQEEQDESFRRFTQSLEAKIIVMNIRNCKHSKPRLYGTYRPRQT